MNYFIPLFINGENVTVCFMTMNLMGIKSNELIDKIEDGGVGIYFPFVEKKVI